MIAPGVGVPPQATASVVAEMASPTKILRTEMVIGGYSNLISLEEVSLSPQPGIGTICVDQKPRLLVRGEG